MRNILALVVFSLVLSLAACDSTSSSPTGNSNPALVGPWKATTIINGNGYNTGDTELVALAANHTFVRSDITDSYSYGGNLLSSTRAVTGGTWSSTATLLILSDSAGTDTASYTQSGTQLTVILPSGTTLDTLIFTKQ